MPAFYNRVFQKDIDFPEVDPSASTPPVRALDVDITERCTLRCTYCFKGTLGLRRDMSFETSQEMVRWLVRNSRETKKLHINFLGGEPMLGFDLLKRWISFATNYCQQRGKRLTVGITSNLTIFTEEHLQTFRFWHIGIHSSIDGMPKVQDMCRVFPDGTGSSQAVERNLPRIFAAWRTTHARSTIVPETVAYLSDSYRYFFEKGFLKVAFSLAGSPKWNEPQYLKTLEEQMQAILEIHRERIKADGRFYSLTVLDEFIRKEGQPQQQVHCGAGRGLLHVDVDGFIWPCHRFNSSVACHEELLLGHVRGGFHSGRRCAYLNILPSRDMNAPCQQCEASSYCGCPCIAANWQEQGSLFDPGDGFCKAKVVQYRQIRQYVEKIKNDDPAFYNQLVDWVHNYEW